MVNREEEMEKVQEEIEINFEIIGATAIEDKLQDQVGFTIDSLKKTGIKVWVLTGDKIETAINIGFSCQLLNDHLEQIIIDGKSKEEVKNALKNGVAIIDQNLPKDYALIISGDALIFAMDPESPDSPELSQMIMKIGDKCNAVLACRVSPKQKKDIVELVRINKPSVTTLAIGDGANDVNMITAAHVGIGIKGVEGHQAARASDYSIGEFKHLKRLLMYYGRESYRKNSELIIYNFFKNMVYVVPQFWLAFHNGFSGQNMFDPFIYQLFNIFYASMPIIIYALLDEEYTGEYLEENPVKYQQGMKNELFNSWTFWQGIASGIIQAFLITIPSFFILERAFINNTGTNYHFWATGMVVFSAVVYNSNFKILLISNTHSVLSLFFIFGSIIFYYITYILIASTVIPFEIYNTTKLYFSTPNVYFLILAHIALTTFIDMGITRFTYFNRLAKTDYVELIDEKEIEIAPPKYKLLRKHTGYAFSQDEPLDDHKRMISN